MICNHVCPLRKALIAQIGSAGGVPYAQKAS